MIAGLEDVSGVKFTLATALLIPFRLKIAALNGVPELCAVSP